jgi:hypothetical protein
MKKKLNILIFLSSVLLLISTYFFYQNKQTIECVSTVSLISDRLQNHKNRYSLTLILNKNFSSKFQNENVKNNILLIDIYSKNVTLVSKIRFIKIDEKIAEKKISNSIKNLANVSNLKILQQDINCKKESAIYNLILPALLLLSLIIYVSIIRIKYIS